MKVKSREFISLPKEGDRITIVNDEYNRIEIICENGKYYVEVYLFNLCIPERYPLNTDVIDFDLKVNF